MPFFGRIRSESRSRARLLKKRAGLRTWNRALGSDGLSADAQAWIMEIEEELRRIEPQIRGELHL